MRPVVPSQDPGRLPSRYRDGLALFFVSKKHNPLLLQSLWRWQRRFGWCSQAGRFEVRL